MIKNCIILLILFSGISVYSQKVTVKDIAMKETGQRYGILGQQAPELTVDQWIDADGNTSAPYQLADHEGKFKVIYCFQAWCPGCHSRGLPALQKMTKAMEGSDKVVFAAIQTVFEGSHANTYDRMVEIQKQYDLQIPFGHDDGKNTARKISSTMQNFRTGGTPWFILIDESGKVVFNDYHLDTDKAIEYLKNL